MRQLYLESGRQIVWQVYSQSPVVGLCHKAHCLVVWVYTEANALLRAVMTDFFFNRWCLEIPWDNCIRHVPGCAYSHAQNFTMEVF
jgi:hypothetical protein